MTVEQNPVMEHPSVAIGGSLELADVTKSFGGIRAIQEVTISVPPGEITCLVGPNGAGKTTLFNLITGVLRPDGGSISYAGHELTAMKTEQIVRLGIARSFQGVRLFSTLTALDNVAVGFMHQAGQSLIGSLLWLRWHRRNRTDAGPKAREILERVGLSHRANVFAAELPLAEQKLLAVGRLLATGVRMLLLDEPLAGLDDSSISTVLSVLRELAIEGNGILLIEHNFDVVRALSDRAVFLSEGEVMFIGSPEEITAQEKLSRLYFGEAGATHG